MAAASAPAQRYSLSAAPAKHVIFATPSTAPTHAPGRLAVRPPPKLRTGVPYPRTGFSRPVTAAALAGASLLPRRVLRATTPLPVNFCWLPTDLTPTRDQGSCGVCWAFAIATCVADRVSAQTGGSVRTALSVRNVQECAGYLDSATPGGCDGNDPYTALRGIVDRGIALRADSAYPRRYDGKPADVAGCVVSTSDREFGVTLSQAFLVTDPTASAADNVAAMKANLYHEGPLVATMEVFQDFMDYDGLTVYEPLSPGSGGNPSVGFHAIEIVGWGKLADSGVGYWICRNSWGSAWPRSHQSCAGVGFFFVRMGADVCRIEECAAGMTPVVHAASAAPRGGDCTWPHDVCRLDAGEWSGSSGHLSAHMAGGSKTALYVGAGVVVALAAGATAWWIIHNRHPHARP